MSLLIVFAGLPGSGKSTVAKALTVRRSAAYVRVDEIEHALAQCSDRAVDAAGYTVAFAIAASNLKLGTDVVADSVNPVLESRAGWRRVAQAAGSGIVEIEIICSDEAEHQCRVDTRMSDIAGFEPPRWRAVQTHVYTPWTTARLIVDTAGSSVEAAVAAIEAHIRKLLPSSAVQSR